MLFFDYAFVFVFLPLTLAVYYRARPGFRNGCLLAASCLFYSVASLYFLPLLLLSSAVDYVAGRQISRTNDSAARKRWLLASLGFNLGALAYFKYVGFVTGTLQDVLGADAVPIVEAALPVGISFYTFQSMSYTIDIYRGRVTPVRSAVDFAAYVTMFPQLIAGPIVRYEQLQGQLVDRSTTPLQFASGVHLFALGLAKKILLADTFAGLAEPIFTAGTPGAIGAWVSMLLFAGQIYFDFSAYSDMAIGLGRMFGFEFPVNFDSPYRATSFSDFWRRWHITLSTWLRDYLYIPLGGNRRGRARTYLNLAVTMLLGGLWHGASWNFVLWGAVHGTLLATERMFRGAVGRIPAYVRRGPVFIAVVVAWVPFKFEDVDATWTWLAAMFGAGTTGVGDVGADQFLGVLAFLGLVWIPRNTSRMVFTPSLRTAGVVAFLLVLSLLFAYGRTTTPPFLYFRF